jgi:DNA-binding MarR family transcriptional regulator
MPGWPVHSRRGTLSVADELDGAVVRLRRTLRRRLREELEVEPLPGPAAELLHLVRGRPGVRVGEAARSLAMAPNTTSTLAQQLEEAGLVRRCSDAADRRVTRLEVTPAGATRLLAWRSSRQAALASALSTLGPADRHAVEEALPALERLVAALDRRDS